jgi:hypothetical protein
LFELAAADIETLRTGDPRQLYEVFPVTRVIKVSDEQRLAYIIKVLQARLAQYLTTIEDDWAQLSQLNLQQEQTGPDFSNSRLLIALKIRAGEKKLLQDAINIFSSQMNGPNAEPPRKKQRR